jgi:glycosyltransferase involved in cell wall biosynthesis
LLKRNYWIDRAITVLSDKTIAVSESTRSYLLQEKKLDARKVMVVRNGRSVNGFRLSLQHRAQLQAEFGISPGELIIGVFGRLEVQKGHRFLFEALPSILTRVPALKVLVVGDGVLRTSLEQQVRDLQLSSAVVFAGYRTDSMPLMSICDVITLPSLYEGMPLVPIEAAALGKPVVATAVDGTREVVVDGLTGKLVPPADSSALARTLLELLLQPERRHAFGQEARVRAQKEFSLEHQLAETASIYEQLLGDTNSTQRKVE